MKFSNIENKSGDDDKKGDNMIMVWNIWLKNID